MKRVFGIITSFSRCEISRCSKTQKHPEPAKPLSFAWDRSAVFTGMTVPVIPCTVMVLPMTSIQILKNLSRLSIPPACPFYSPETLSASASKNSASRAYFAASRRTTFEVLECLSSS